jgi:hypothetical protein
MDLTRQADLIPAGSLNSPVLILGAGNIGSNVARLIAAIGVKDITVFDPDRVGSENVGPSLFGREEVGVNKALALAVVLERDYNISVNAVATKFPLQHEGVYRFVIQAIDDKPARREIWYQVLKPQVNLRWQWLIDARMGADLFTVATILADDKPDCLYYEEWLDSPPGELSCGEKATAFQTQGLISGTVGMVMAQIARGQQPPREVFMKTFDSYVSITRRA